MSAAIHPTTATTSTRPNRRFTVVKALSMVGSLAVSVGGLMTVSSVIASPANAAPSSCGAPAGAGLQQNINTSQGCDVSAGTSQMSGYISDSGLGSNHQVTLEDAYEGLSTHLFYYGAYSLTLNCSEGSASPAVSSYVIEQGTGSYPSTPPIVSSGTLPVVTADSAGNILCAWLLSVQSAPSGHLNSSKSDLWIVAGGSGHTATASVKPPVLTDPPAGPTITPPPPVAPPSTDPGTTPTSDPTTTVSTDPGTTPPTDPTTTVSTDPGTTPPTDPTTTVTPTTDPGSTSTTDPSSTPGTGGVTTTTAPVLHTGTDSDPSSTFTGGNDPTTTTAGEPRSASSTPSPATPSAASPHGLTALAFTGSISETLAVIGLMLIGAGGLILSFTRRWRGARP